MVFVDLRDHEVGVVGIDAHVPCGAGGQVIAAIYAEHVSRDPFSGEACKALSSMLVTTIARSAGKVNASRLSYLVSRAQSELLNADAERCLVSAAAARLFVSEAWMTKKFREEVGQTPAAWLMSCKMAPAKRLLRVTTDPVGDIAFQLGFASSQYFATAFRRETGRTPSEYRHLYPTQTSSNA